MTEKFNQIEICFITEVEEEKLLASGNFQSIVRLKLYNELNNDDFEREVIILVASTDNNKVKQCIKEMCRVKFPWAKSYQIRTTVKES